MLAFGGVHFGIFGFLPPWVKVLYRRRLPGVVSVFVVGGGRSSGFQDMLWKTQLPKDHRGKCLFPLNPPNVWFQQKSSQGPYPLVK